MKTQVNLAYCAKCRHFSGDTEGLASRHALCEEVQIPSKKEYIDGFWKDSIYKKDDEGQIIINQRFVVPSTCPFILEMVIQ